MWMMGYNDGAEFNLPDSFNGRKLRPLIPRPNGAASANNARTTNLNRIHGTDLLALNHHLATVAADQSKREFNAQQVIVSSRWNPTPEQLQTLEELYRRGTRTPSTEEIQHITAQLRQYGKIEGKNVFYWFQNHKARERQKRRRQLESASDEQQFRDMDEAEKKESGANRTGFEVEQTKNWAPPTNSSTLAEKTVSIERAAKAAISECRADGWIQFDEGELQRRRERNATWQMMQLSCSPHTNLINYTTSTTTPATVRTMDPKLLNLSTIFITPNRPDDHHNHLFSVGDRPVNDASACEESQTLQLFPLRSDNGNGNRNSVEEEPQISPMNTSSSPCQFFEFLPLKN